MRSYHVHGTSARIRMPRIYAREESQVARKVIVFPTRTVDETSRYPTARLSDGTSKRRRRPGHCSAHLGLNSLPGIEGVHPL